MGKAIKASGVPRKEIYLVTKLWNNSHHPDDVEPALDASLKDLDTDYVDLYLMHWPVAFKRGDQLMPKGSNGKMLTEKIDYVDVRLRGSSRFMDTKTFQTYKAMEKLLKTGKTKAIGISNFSKGEIERLLKETTVVPAAHQLELHPYLQQHEFLKYNTSKGIFITQYSPFGNQNEIYGSKLGKLVENPTLVEIGKKYNRSGAQVALGGFFKWPGLVGSC